MKNNHKIYTDVIAKSGSKNEPLEVTANGVYEAPIGIGYSPVKVNVPQTAESGTLKYLLDKTKSTYYLFYSYTGTSIDDLIKFSDTSNVTNMGAMFIYCSNLTSIPKFDTSNVTNMSNMFQACYSLTTIPQLDTSNVTDMSSMFNNCYNLTSVPQLDTSNVTNMGYMFNYCSNLTSIPQLDVSKCTSFSNTFNDCRELTSIGIYGFTRSVDITDTALEHDALVAFLNQAGTAYNSSQKITMGSDKLALLNDEEKAIAINKRWTLA